MIKRMKYIPLLLLVVFASCKTDSSKDYLQYVDMMIGTTASTLPAIDGSKKLQENGQTIITAGSPFAMTQWTVQMHSTEYPCNAPFYYGTVFTHGFRGSHWLSGACDKDYASIGVIPTTLSTEFKFLPEQRQTLALVQYEEISPAFISLGFPAMQLITDFTGTKHCGFFRFAWLLPEDPTILLTVNNDDNKGYIKIDLENQEIVGYNPVNRNYFTTDEKAGFSGYFVARFDHEINKYGTFGNFDITHGSTENTDQQQMGAYVSFLPENGEAIGMKVGTSFTSIENARLNLETEIADWDFEGTKSATEKEWNDLLGTIEVESTDTSDLTKFYTALYHSLLQPRLFSDVNGDYPAFSKQYEIRNSKEFDYYGDFSARDIYRAQMPLLSLIAPKQYNDMVKSIVAKAEEGDWLPGASRWNNFYSKEAGDHLTSILTDAAMKGFDFDVEKAYSFMLKNATQSPESDELEDGKGRRGLESYIEFGYIPLDETENGSSVKKEVARTLEYAYNDWCIAQMAQKLGNAEDQTTFNSRALNYTNIFDEENKLMNGRYSDGTFFEDLDPNKEEAFFFEGSARQYSLDVPHDVPGLIEMMDNESAFSDELDGLLQSPAYDHANPICQHIPFLYNYTGDWAKTQETVKHILDTQYATDPGGLAGQERSGQLSAWYVFSAMGFYPVCPGSNEYQLSSPIFEKVTLHLDKDFYPNNTLDILADPDEKTGIYKSAVINGKELNTVLKHEDIREGGKLTFSK